MPSALLSCAPQGTAAGPAAGSCGHEPGFCAFPMARSAAGRGGGQTGSSMPRRRREVAAVAAARACPESMSRSEPASTAGTGQWVSRRGLECSFEEGGKQTERATQSKAVTHRHFGTREGCCGAAMRARGEDVCKGVCVSQTLSEQVPKGLRVLWSRTHFVMSLSFCHPALLCRHVAQGTGSGA